MQTDDLDFDPDAHVGPLADRLDALGLADLGRRLRDLLAEPRPSTVDLTGLISLAEAAVLLGLRSPSTVRELFEQGLLEGVRHDGMVFVAPTSVDRLLGSPALAMRRRVEDQLWSLLDDFEPF